MNNFKKISAAILIIAGLGLQVTASALCPQAVRVAIKKYKAQDYVGCIQDLEDYSDTDPSNTVAYYYTGIAYMKVGMKNKAIEAFHKVSTINSVPILSSYAIQATNCMNTGINPCVYKKFSKEDIEEMVANPAEFFAKKAQEPEDKAETVKIDDTTDIDKLIQGVYPEDIHPDANKVIQETRLIQEQERVNAELKKRSKPSAPKPQENQQNTSDATIKKTDRIASAELSDKEIADAVRTLSKAGYKFTAPNDNNSVNNQNINPYKQLAAQYALQDDAAQMALMFGGNNNNRNNSFDTILPYLLMQEQQNSDGTTQKRKIDPELIKAVMMNQMMGDFDLGLDNKNK